MTLPCFSSCSPLCKLHMTASSSGNGNDSISSMYKSPVSFLDLLEVGALSHPMNTLNLSFDSWVHLFLEADHHQCYAAFLEVHLPALWALSSNFPVTKLLRHPDTSSDRTAQTDTWTPALTGLCLSLLNATTSKYLVFPSSLSPVIIASLIHSLRITHRYKSCPLCIITYRYNLCQFFLCWIC